MSLFASDTSRSIARQKPLEVAPETFVIRGITPSVGGSWTCLNSMVIRGGEPIIVDCGMNVHRDTWFEDVFSLVRAEDVRWIFISHNDSDHAGNLAEAFARCANAMVVNSHGESFRTSAAFGIPYERILMLAEGESFEAGGRKLQSIRPPVYDSPYTRGLFDPSTQLYYSSDAFCAPMPHEPVDWSDQIAPELWASGMAQFHHNSVCPWIAMANPKLFKAEVDKLAKLGMQTIVSAHSPVIRAGSVAQALVHLAALPSAAPAAMVWK